MLTSKSVYVHLAVCTTNGHSECSSSEARYTHAIKWCH